MVSRITDKLARDNGLTANGTLAEKIDTKASRNEKKMYAFDLLSRGFGVTDIENKCRVSHVTAVNYKKEWKQTFVEKSISDPFILEKVIENVYRLLDELEMQYKEAWTVYDGAVEDKDKVAALRVCKDLSAEKAKILRLTDLRIEIVNQTTRAMRAQEALLAILSDASMFCDGCREAIGMKLVELEESMHGKIAAKALPNGDDESIIEGEVVNA